MKSKRAYLVLSLFAVLILLTATGLFLNLRTASAEEAEDTAHVPSISVGDTRWSIRGGVLALTSEQAPYLDIYFSEQQPVTAEIRVYKSNLNALLKFLVHDKKTNQLNSAPDTADLTFIATVTTTPDTESHTRALLPLESSGIYYVSANVAGHSTSTSAFIVRSGIGTVVSEMENSYLFWTQNIAGKRSVTKGTVSLYNFTDKISLISKKSISYDGTAKIEAKPAEAAIVESGGEIALVPLNLYRLNLNADYDWWYYGLFSANKASNKFFLFTDRPLYRPGDKIYFKSIVRKYLNGNLSLPSSMPVRVFVYKGYDPKNILLEKKLYLNQSGSIDGELDIPASAAPGNYNVVIENDLTRAPLNAISGSGSTGISIEHFRKPDYYLEVNTPVEEFVKGDEFSFTIKGSYFFGKPLAGKTVHYTLELSEISTPGDYSTYLWYKSDLQDMYYGWNRATLGDGQVTLDEKGEASIVVNGAMLEKYSTSDRLVRLVAEYIDDTQSRSIAGKTAVMHRNEYEVYSNYRDEYAAGAVGSVLEVPLIFVSNRTGKTVENIYFSVSSSLERWRNDSGKYVREQENFDGMSLTSDKQGKAVIKFIPQKSGSYHFAVSFSDSRGNSLNKVFYRWVREKNYSCDYCYEYDDSDGADNFLTIEPDKEEYRPSETVKLNLRSEIADRDVLVTLQRDFVSEYKVVKLSGKSGAVSFSAAAKYMPNIIARAESFSSGNINIDDADISVSTASKQLKISVKTDKETYGPGERVNVEIKTTDGNGLPVPAELTVWGVDKAIFELSASNLGNIFNNFWSRRLNLTLSRHSLEGIITYYDGAEKGGGGDGEGARTIFKDTAFWLPKVRSNSAGRAVVSFILPDNLTTWRLTAVGSNASNIFGQQQKDVIVSKDVVLRPILPNLLRTGDSLVVTSYLQNYLSSKQIFDVSLAFPGATVEPANKMKVSLDPMGDEQIDWQVKDLKVNPKAKLTFSAFSEANPKKNDVVVNSIPVVGLFYTEKRAETARGDHQFDLKLSSDSDPVNSKISLSLAASFYGQLPEAMNYLLDYPYGCVEQTTSRLVPLIIAKANESLYKSVLAGKDIDDMIFTGLSRLGQLQSSNGGWSFWYGNKNDMFITAYVVENLALAKKAGYFVDSDVINRAKEYLSGSAKTTTGTAYALDIVAKTYALSALHEKEGEKRLDELDNLPVEYLAMAIMANHKNNYDDLRDKGIDLLLSKMIQPSEGMVYWPGDKNETFYWSFSSNDAATAFAIRALLTSDKYYDTIAKAVAYMVGSKKQAYWSNTFATAQVMKAASDFAAVERLTQTKIAYSVTLDGREIKRGVFSGPRDNVTLTLPAANIKSGGSVLKISKSGSGQIYSSLNIEERRTDMTKAKSDNGISVTREYINTKGADVPIGVGDKVKVVIKITVPTSSRDYGVVEDQLPAGLIPINKNLLNERSDYSQSWEYYCPYCDDWGEEATENGMVMYFSPWYTRRLNSNEITLEYKARAIAEGTFSAPPAEASLMYIAGVDGRSEAATLSIIAQSPDLPEQTEAEVKGGKELTVKTEKETAPAPRELRIGVEVFIIGGMILLIAGFITMMIIWYKKVTK